MRDKDNDEIVLEVLKAARRLLEITPRWEHTKNILLPDIKGINLDNVGVYDGIVEAIIERKQGDEAISLAQEYLLFEHNNGIVNKRRC